MSSCVKAAAMFIEPPSVRQEGNPGQRGKPATKPATYGILSKKVSFLTADCQTPHSPIDLFSHSPITPRMTRGIRIGITLLALGLICSTVTLEAQEENQTGDSETAIEASQEASLPDSGYRLVQPDDILFTFIGFRDYNQLHQLQEQMLAIPGLTNFIPQLETAGLLTYQLHYSGTTEQLMNALQELFGAQYELGLKQMGENSWEITMRRGNQPTD